MFRLISLALVLCFLSGCSAKKPTADNIAQILSMKPDNIRVTGAEVEDLSCSESNGTFDCQFMLHGTRTQMRLVQVGGGAFSESR